MSPGEAGTSRRIGEIRKKSQPWYVYLVRCADDTIYTGITNNVSARIEKHNNGSGAKYTSTRGPVALIYQEKHTDQGSALKRETQIKRWSRARKLKLSEPGRRGRVSRPEDARGGETAYPERSVKVPLQLTPYPVVQRSRP